MGQILSRSEVEAILSSLDLSSRSSKSDAGNIELGSEQIAAYDFEHPERLKRPQLDALRLAAAAASQSLQTNLSQILRTNLLVNFLGIEQSTYRDYLATTEAPGCIAVVESNDSPSRWLLDVSRSLAITFIDCMLGGCPFDPKSLSAAPRPYTAVETRLIERVLSAILPDFAGTFTRRNPLRTTHLYSETSYIQESSSNEAVALVSFEVVCGENQGLMQLCIPWKQVADATKRSSGSERTFRDAVQSGSVKVPITVTARVAGVRLTASQLASLNPGDILLTDVEHSNEMSLEVDGCPIFQGKPGQSQNKKVIQLTVPVSHSFAGNAPVTPPDPPPLS